MNCVILDINSPYSSLTYKMEKIILLPLVTQECQSPMFLTPWPLTQSNSRIALPTPLKLDVVTHDLFWPMNGRHVPTWLVLTNEWETWVTFRSDHVHLPVLHSSVDMGGYCVCHITVVFSIYSRDEDLLDSLLHPQVMLISAVLASRKKYCMRAAFVLQKKNLSIFLTYLNLLM